MDIKNYSQDETTKIINDMRTAERRTANTAVRKALDAGCARLREMESVIFQLRDQVKDLELDNDMLSKDNAQLITYNEQLRQKQKSADSFDYTKMVSDFYASGEMFRKVLLEKHGDKTPWYTPKLNKVRKAIEKMNLPIEVQQRTSVKDPSVTPIMIMFRADDSEEECRDADI